MAQNINYNGWELYFFDNAKNFRNYQWNLIRKYVKKSILEVGPGNCVFLKNYNKLCNKIYLFEPSKNLRRKLKKKVKKLKKVILVKNYPKCKFDTIIYLDVLEHIKHDKKEILKAYYKLKKNGYLVISVPAFQYLYTIYDKKIGHYKRYNKKFFNHFLPKLKITDYSMSYFDSLGYLLIFISKFIFFSYKVDFKISIKLWDKLIPLSKMLDYFLNFFIGKSLMLIIRKN